MDIYRDMSELDPLVIKMAISHEALTYLKNVWFQVKTVVRLDCNASLAEVFLSTGISLAQHNLYSYRFIDALDKSDDKRSCL